MGNSHKNRIRCNTTNYSFEKDVINCYNNLTDNKLIYNFIFMTRNREEHIYCSNRRLVNGRRSILYKLLTFPNEENKRSNTSYLELGFDFISLLGFYIRHNYRYIYYHIHNCDTYILIGSAYFDDNNFYFTSDITKAICRLKYIKNYTFTFCRQIYYESLINHILHKNTKHLKSKYNAKLTFILGLL